VNESSLEMRAFQVVSFSLDSKKKRKEKEDGHRKKHPSECVCHSTSIINT
jgi:hypothetical protein